MHPSLPFTRCKLRGEQTEPGLWWGGASAGTAGCRWEGPWPPLIHVPYRRVTRRLFVYKSNTQWAQLSTWFEFSSFLLSFVFFFSFSHGPSQLQLGSRPSHFVVSQPHSVQGLSLQPASPSPLLGLAGRCTGRRKRGLGAGSGRDGDDFRSDCTDRRAAA